MSTAKKMLSPKAFIHPLAVVEDGAILEEDAKVWHFAHVRQTAHLEHSVSVGKDCYIDAGVRIGRGSRIQNSVNVYAGIQIAEWCFVGPAVVFTNDQNPRVGNKTWTKIETRLEAGASIGAGAVIRCGVTIGAFSMVGAGAVVTKSVPPFHLAVGLPAKITSMICACGQSKVAAGSPRKSLIRTCCEKNMDPQVLKIAQAQLELLKR
jgi:UDP-2-acetamido-3-amino-2,3-dideoxy-glucuronate N-acetyltransferase